MRRLLFLVLVACGGNPDPHVVVGCDRVGAAPGQQCEIGCARDTMSIDAPACVGHHPEIADPVDCQVIEEFEGIRGCCTHAEGEVPNDPDTVILFAECE